MTDANSHLKVVRLEGSNYKRLKAVTIEPDADGNLVIIAGRNAQGKTSVLDLIFAVLAGTKGSKGTPEPINTAADEAEGTVDLGDFTVTRKWKRGKASSLTITTKDGISVKSPQAFLDDLLGRWSFDPLEFMGLKDGDQRAELLKLIELPFDLDEKDRERADIFETRTVSNRAVKELEGQLAGYPPVDPKLPLEEVGAIALLDGLRQVEELHAQYASAVDSVTGWDNAVEKYTALLAEARSNAETARAYVASLPALPSLEDARQAVNNSEELNARIRKQRERALTVQKLEGQQLRSNELTASIKAIDDEKAAALAAAQFPLAGLNVDADGVTYNEIPLKQASGAEQLKVAIALAIATNPVIRVIRITDASLLDSQSVEVVRMMAEHYDVQVWLEVVDETGAVGIVIEDGEVAG